MSSRAAQKTPSAKALAERLATLKLLVLDVDGILTDGRLYYGEHGELLKAFHVHDGLGMKLLSDNGVGVAIISAKRSAPLIKRLADLKIDHRLGRHDKLTALDELLDDFGLSDDDVAYAGDDLIDIPVMRRVGVALTVSDARPQVQAEADWITTAAGGHGAVREISDAILDARGELESAIDALLAGLNPPPNR